MMTQQQTQATEGTQEQKAAVNKKATSSKKIAVLLVRGLVNAHRDVKKTCQHLHLHKRLNCRIIENNAVNRGMILRVKDFVTFGAVSSDTEKLLEKRKQKDNYTLHPPRGGFERGGIKKSWKRGGVLGERDEMNSLLAKMV